jgi:hypothetical protein
MLLNAVPEPWASFLAEIDASTQSEIELHCLGGFVVTVLYGMARPTADVDILVIAPRGESERLLSIAGKGSALHYKVGLYLDLVTVATVPEDYAQRETEIFPGAFKHLRLFAFDPYDIALSKLERNIQRDRDDVKYLARTVPFDLDLLKERYEKELRPYLAIPEREDLTLRLWLDAITEDSKTRGS